MARKTDEQRAKRVAAWVHITEVLAATFKALGEDVEIVAERCIRVGPGSVTFGVGLGPLAIVGVPRVQYEAGARYTDGQKIVHRAAPRWRLRPSGMSWTDWHWFVVEIARVAGCERLSGARVQAVMKDEDCRVRRQVLRDAFPDLGPFGT